MFNFLYNPTSLTCQIVIPDLPPCKGIQKFVGFSRGWHHWNSVRLGIRKENDYCVLYLYAYVRGERIVKRCNWRVYVGDKLTVIVRWHKTGLIVLFGNEADCATHYVEHTFKDYIYIKGLPIGYLLYPYFETDAPENKRKPLDVRIWNVKINNKTITL